MNTNAAESPPAILYAEDDETDVFLMTFALRKARIPHPLKIVRNGDEAIAYLSGDGLYADRQQFPFPGLVLLDLHMPRRSGLKVLQWIREQPHLARLPVIVYTSSEHPIDIERSKTLGANEYLVKPAVLDQIASLLNCLVQRWLDVS